MQFSVTCLFLGAAFVKVFAQKGNLYQDDADLTITMFNGSFSAGVIIDRGMRDVNVLYTVYVMVAFNVIMITTFCILIGHEWLHPQPKVRFMDNRLPEMRLFKNYKYHLFLCVPQTWPCRGHLITPPPNTTVFLCHPWQEPLLEL